MNKANLFTSTFTIALLLCCTDQVVADSVNYVYDSLNRIVEADYADGSKIQYSYDPNGNRVAQTVTAPTSTGTTDSVARTECLFNWAETNYGNLFAPKSQTTSVWYPYRYRYYSQTNAYVALSVIDNHIYYMNPASNNTLMDEGTASYWWQQAGC